MERRALLDADATSTTPAVHSRAILATSRDTLRKHSYLVACVGLILAAWIALALWHTGLAAAMLMPLGAPISSPLLYAPTVAAAWALMATAMMLPGSLPHVGLAANHDDQSQGGKWPATRFVVGYVALYALLGLALSLVVTMLRAMLVGSHAGGVFALAVSGVILVSAGAYQWTPAKDHCLERCRVPHADTEHTAERHAGLLCGLRHGLWCLGSCGGLMLAMLALGAMSLWTMLLLGAVMAAEKVAPWGAPLARVLGVLLLLAGLATLLGFHLPPLL
jgi:predicted metal-binding membrane protein